MAGRLDNYVSVAERLALATHEIKTITATRPEMLGEAMGFMVATVELQDGRVASGTASFWLNKTGQSAQATNPIEDCETSAVGRALAFLGYSSSKSIASREEVQEAERRAAYTPPARQPEQQQAQSERTLPRHVQAGRKYFDQFQEVVGGRTWKDAANFLTLDPKSVPDSEARWQEVTRLTAARVQAAKARASGTHLDDMTHEIS